MDAGEFVDLNQVVAKFISGSTDNETHSDQ